MANRNTSGFGLIAAGTVGSTPATQGQGKYYIDAGMAVDLFQGCTVKSKAGYIVEASSTRTFLSIGVFNGIFYNASTTLKPTWANWYNQPITPANSEDITCFVIRQSVSTFCRIYSMQQQLKLNMVKHIVSELQLFQQEVKFLDNVLIH